MYSIIILLIGIGVLILLERAQSSTSHIHTLIRQTARWAIASAQDEDALIAVLHANYAVGYLSALKEIATDTQIEQATGLDLIEFQRDIQQVQDQATKRAIDICPNFAPQHKLANIARNE